MTVVFLDCEVHKFYPDHNIHQTPKLNENCDGVLQESWGWLPRWKVGDYHGVKWNQQVVAETSSSGIVSTSRIE